jgi:hypothetical protein
VLLRRLLELAVAREKAEAALERRRDGSYRSNSS